MSWVSILTFGCASEFCDDTEIVKLGLGFVRIVVATLSGAGAAVKYMKTISK